MFFYFFQQRKKKMGASASAHKKSSEKVEEKFWYAVVSIPVYHTNKQNRNKGSLAKNIFSSVSSNRQHLVNVLLLASSALRPINGHIPIFIELTGNFSGFSLDNSLEEFLIKQRNMANIQTFANEYPFDIQIKTDPSETDVYNMECLALVKKVLNVAGIEPASEGNSLLKVPQKIMIDNNPENKPISPLDLSLAGIDPMTDCTVLWSDPGNIGRIWVATFVTNQDGTCFLKKIEGPKPTSGYHRVRDTKVFEVTESEMGMGLVFDESGMPIKPIGRKSVGTEEKKEFTLDISKLCVYGKNYVY